MSKIAFLCGCLITLSLNLGNSVTSCAQQASPPAEVQNTADETALRALVEAYFNTLSAKDLDGFLKLWSKKSPELESRTQATRKLFTDYEKIEVKNLTVLNVTLEGENATLRVDMEVSAMEAKSGKNAAGFGLRKQVMECIRENDGWRVWREESGFERLAGKLIEAATEQERDRLLAGEKDLWSTSLTSALSARGIRFASKGQYPQAIHAFLIMGNVAERIGDRGVSASALNNLGLAYSTQADFEPALEYLKKSLQLAESLQDKSKMARALNNLGSVYQKLGQYNQALDCYRKSLEAAQSQGDKSSIAAAFGSIGNVFNAQSNSSLAAESYQKSLAYYRESGEVAGEARILNSLGNIQCYQGNLDLALEFYKESLALKEKAGSKVEQGRTLENIGYAYLVGGDFDRAEEYYRKSMALYEASDVKGELAGAVAKLGNVYLARGNYGVALGYFQKSLGMSEAIGEKSTAGLSLASLAEVYLLEGKPAQAQESSRSAGKIAEELGSLELLWTASVAEGKAYRRMNHPAQARQAFEKAISTIETMRTQAVGGEQELQGFLVSKVTPYHELIRLLIDQNQPGEALAFAERSKARVLLDVLQRGKTDVHKAMTGAELLKEQKLKGEISSLNLRLTRAVQSAKSDPSATKDLNARLEEARFNYEAFQTSLYAEHPELKVRRGEAPVIKTTELKTLLPDTSSALLEYVVTGDRSYLFAVTRATSKADADVRVYTLTIKQEELSRQIETFRKLLAGRDLGFRASALKLYQLLLEPAQEQLRGKTSLLIVPDDKLWELPFQALLSGPNRYLIETSAISFAPSLTVLREMRNARDRRRADATTPVLLAMGNPAVGDETAGRARLVLRNEELGPLPEAEQEVRALERLYGKERSKVYVGAEAREDRIKNEAGQARILHFATHGILNDAAPMYSHLVLAHGDSNEDGLLEAWELMQLNLKADLAVLSACETARGRFGAGEGMIGLTWALFVAGVPTTVVSQWQVESASTRDLMVDFHEALNAPAPARKATKSKAQALQQAEVKLLSSELTRHPFYWAGFVLVGDGR